ncbi:MAG: insulinase family protein [Prolixibacteraceae bacterium]|jgi:zinc protease|nr:insulinase family protein [Prolixibacteraceae bacterium]
MTRLHLFGLIAIFVISACTPSAKYKTLQKTDANGYTYETVVNDPLNTRIYTLDNGLKVYLSPNADEPRVNCLIGVRAGSTSDPKETTGLAHYFEHMMFKGTPRLGTTNWEEESKLIEQIEQLYEKHLATDDPIEKKAIYKEIDELSNEAAKYVATNEYDKLMSSIGAKGTNAGTSYESTVYINDVPVNELEKWAKLESERFHGIVLRLFHTELETVYEEFNMYQDRDSERAFHTLMNSLFPNHPYGRDIIGYPEDIKNPSMINIQEFYKTFYVPNNMAIALSGDINFEETILLLEKYFGDLEYRELPEHESIVEEPITEVITNDVVGPEPENVMVAFRMGGVGSTDQAYCDVIDMLMSNSQAGLIDLNLVQEQKVLWAGSFYYALKDYGLQAIQGAPLEGQTLEEVAKLMLDQLDSIKEGNFDEWLIQAVINDIKLNKIRGQERNGSRTYELMGNFIDGLSREQALSYMNTLESITKEDIIAFANEKYTNNYVVVNKRQGDNAQLVKVEKPEITAVPVNRDFQSDFAKKFKEMESSDVEPVFINFEEKIATEELQAGCNYYYLKNESNDIFSLRYIIEMGSWHDLNFELAVGYLKFLGTDKFNAPDLQKELYKYGLDIDVTTGDERSYITIRGLNESFEKGVELLEHIIANAKPDAQAYADYKGRILKDRSDQKAEQQTILWQAMFDYGVYGTESPFKNLLSEEELNAIDPAVLTGLLKDMTTFKHNIFYYGPAESSKVKAVLKAMHNLPGELADIPAPKEFKQSNPEGNKVYVVDFDINQANILMVSNGDEFSKEMMPIARIYNEFYGSGLSSVVFQEIRESKALAYSAYAGYRSASKQGRQNTLLGYLGTQADKLPIATETLLDLLNEMPKAEKQYDMAREAIVKKINTERITKENIFWTWQRNMDRGIDYDIRKDDYEAAKSVTMEEFEKFFNTKIKGQDFTFLVLGNIDNLDKKALKSLGEVKELSLEEIFGY